MISTLLFYNSHSLFGSQNVIVNQWNVWMLKRKGKLIGGVPPRGTLVPYFTTDLRETWDKVYRNPACINGWGIVLGRHVAIWWYLKWIITCQKGTAAIHMHGIRKTGLKCRFSIDTEYYLPCWYHLITQTMSQVNKT